MLLYSLRNGTPSCEQLDSALHPLPSVPLLTRFVKKAKMPLSSTTTTQPAYEKVGARVMTGVSAARLKLCVQYLSIHCHSDYSQ